MHTQKHSPCRRLHGRALLLAVLGCAASSAIAATMHDHDKSGITGKSVATEARVDGKAPAISPDLAGVARWIAATRDNHGLPYLLIDKVNAEVVAFDRVGQLQAIAPALLGLARGDRSVDGVGDKKMSAIRPQERITPAGRFVASLGRDPQGKEILWIDYANAIALHPIVKGTPQEHRAERLASASAADKRISFGCINVPEAFYQRFVSSAFRHTSGIVYILPEASPAGAYFGFRDSASAARSMVPADPVRTPLAEPMVNH